MNYCARGHITAELLFLVLWFNAYIVYLYLYKANPCVTCTPVQVQYRNTASLTAHYPVLCMTVLSEPHKFT